MGLYTGFDLHFSATEPQPHDSNPESLGTPANFQATAESIHRPVAVQYLGLVLG